MIKKILACFMLLFLLVACLPQTPRSLPDTVSPTWSIEFTETALNQPTSTLVSTPTQEVTATLTSTSTPPPAPATASTTAAVDSPTPVSQVVQGSGGAIIIDHTSVALFDSIPAEYIDAARNLKMVYYDKSVGLNISEGLDCLAAESWVKSRPGCRSDYIDENWNWKLFTVSSQAPERIQFTPDAVKYNRDNWMFEVGEGTWSQLTEDFIVEYAPSQISSKDVLSFQFNYQQVMDGEDIADPNKGFFSDNPNRYDIFDLEAFMAEHPDKVFFHWTTSLARSIGTQVSTDFNNQMRQYVQDHNAILFDVADIESHTDQGVPCYDNRDDIQYCAQNSGKCENYPDDDKSYPAICQDYTTETNGGHLGSVSGGRIRLAKAYWVLMARIAGWTP